MAEEHVVIGSAVHDKQRAFEFVRVCQNVAVLVASLVLLGQADTGQQNREQTQQRENQRTEPNRAMKTLDNKVN